MCMLFYGRTGATFHSLGQKGRKNFCIYFSEKFEKQQMKVNSSLLLSSKKRVYTLAKISTNKYLVITFSGQQKRINYFYWIVSAFYIKQFFILIISGSFSIGFIKIFCLWYVSCRFQHFCDWILYCWEFRLE